MASQRRGTRRTGAEQSTPRAARVERIDTADASAKGRSWPQFAVLVGVVVLLVIGLATGVYAVSESGPGSMHAPVLVALIVALVIGAIAQNGRLIG